MKRTLTPILLVGTALLAALTSPAQKADDASGQPMHSPAYRPAAPAVRSGGHDMQRTIIDTYCLPTYTTGTTDGDFIDGVQLGTLDNIANGSAAAPFYTDYSWYASYTTTRLAASSNYTLSVTNGTYALSLGEYEGFSAWIDYDQDGVFDLPTEQLGYTQATSAGQIVTINFTVPADAAQGYTTLRVRVSYGTASLDPCLDYTYGETEDYTVLIENGSCIPLYNFGTADGDSLSSVSCAGLNFVSADNLFTDDPYSDYFMLGTQLTRGGNYSITLGIGAYQPEYAGAWIDWNFDGDWDDAGEALGLTQVTTVYGTTTFNFTVPATAFVGYTKLRTRAVYLGAAATACSDAGFGETIDFTVSIVAGVYTCLPIQGWGTTANDGFLNATLDGNTYDGGIANTLWPYYRRALGVFRYDRGTSHTIDIVNGGWAGERFQAYMDMNDDGDLTDAGEDFGYVQASSAGQALGLVFTIPASCPPGQHTLRLRAFDPVNFPPTDGCDDQGYGETLDFQVAVEDPAGPCIPHMANWTTDNDFINGVQVNLINNPGTGGAFAAAYHDYTAMGTTLDIGTNYTLTIQGGNFVGDYYYAWIDYNGDNDFDDAGEALGSVVIPTALGNGTINFTVPAATLGPKRLRVRSLWTVSTANACTDAGYGETEDYTVTIQTGTGINASIASAVNIVPKPSSGLAEVYAGSDWNNATLNLVEATGRVLATGTITGDRTDVNMTGMSAGAYTIIITGGDRTQALRFVWEQY